MFIPFLIPYRTGSTNGGNPKVAEREAKPHFLLVLTCGSFAPQNAGAPFGFPLKLSEPRYQLQTASRPELFAD